MKKYNYQSGHIWGYLLILFLLAACPPLALPILLIIAAFE